MINEHLRTLLCGDKWTCRCLACGNVTNGVAYVKGLAAKSVDDYRAWHRDCPSKELAKERKRQEDARLAERQLAAMVVQQREAHRARRSRAMLVREHAAAASEVSSLAEPKGHMAELADGWMPEWVKVPT